ncbi:MAG: peptide chain release factor aRF-1 [Candidatus Nanoarchaeia archaeon]|nr:peptide chain release factor aRF-1 [Candidatus Nanoarchaeia archaeon]
MNEAKYHLKKIIKKLEKIKGRHTELVTVYVPAGFSLDIIANQIFQERHTATNIKSKSTRKNVLSALDKIINELKKYKQTPKNGLVVFSGNVSEDEGKEDLQIWMLEPPEPNKIRLYRCDQDFILEPLKDMITEKKVYGLLTVDFKDACIAILAGKRPKILKNMDSAVPGKTRQGGQSAQRFQRVRSNIIKHWYVKVADTAVEIYRDMELQGIILGGPGPAKEELAASSAFAPLKPKVLGMVNIGYGGEDGIPELISKSKDILKEEEIYREKETIGNFFSNLARETGLATYGVEEVKSAVMMGAVSKVILSEGIEEDVFEEIGNLCDKHNVLFEIYSTETEEGEQFFRMGGVGAFLKFRVY